MKVKGVYEARKNAIKGLSVNAAICRTLKELPVNKTEENKSSHTLPTTPLPPTFSLSSLFSSIFSLCFASMLDLWLSAFLSLSSPLFHIFHSVSVSPCTPFLSSLLCPHTLPNGCYFYFCFHWKCICRENITPIFIYNVIFQLLLILHLTGWERIKYEWHLFKYNPKSGFLPSFYPHKL